MKSRPVPVYRACDPQHLRGVLYVVEGPAKALALAAAGFPSLGLGGVTTTLTRTDSGHVLNDSWPAVAGRTVVIIFDANRRTNVQVAVSESRLAKALMHGGARVLVADLPCSPEGDGWGPDDFLASVGRESLADVIVHALPADPVARVAAVGQRGAVALRHLAEDLPFLLSVPRRDCGTVARLKRIFARYDLGFHFIQKLVIAQRALAAVNREISRPAHQARVRPAAM